MELVPEWLECRADARALAIQILKRPREELISIGKADSLIDEDWCDARKIRKVFDLKKKMYAMDMDEVRERINRQNPHEPLDKVLFCTRTGMQAAAIDSIFDFMLTKETRNTALAKHPLDPASVPVNSTRDAPIFTFAEGYYNAIGYVPRKTTYRTKASSDKWLRAPKNKRILDYKHKQDMDQWDELLRPNELKDFSKFVHSEQPAGVDLMMGDLGAAGFNTLEREWKSTPCHVAQLITALSIVNSQGSACIKLAGSANTATVGLIFWAHIAFERIALCKPNTSRRTSSERFLIASKPIDGVARAVRNLLYNALLRELGKVAEQDLLSIVPTDLLKNAREFDDFRRFVIRNNNEMATMLIWRLEQFLEFSPDAMSLAIGHKLVCRKTCTRFYDVPDIDKSSGSWLPRTPGDPGAFLAEFCKRHGFTADPLRVVERLLPQSGLEQFLLPSQDDNFCHFTPLACSDQLPSILVVTKAGQYMHRLLAPNQNDQPWTEFGRGRGGQLFLPFETILLVEAVDSKNVNPGHLRILDAALLAGDDVSTLPLMQRLSASKKCLQVFQKNVDNSATISVADAITLIDLRNSFLNVVSFSPTYNTFRISAAYLVDSESDASSFLNAIRHSSITVTKEEVAKFFASNAQTAK